MPIFNSVEEAHEAHRNYHIDTDEEGKYNRRRAIPGRLRIDWLLENTPEESFVLEVGCNSGGLCKLLKDERRCFVKGIDICEDMVQRAVAKGVSARIGVAENIPFKDSQFEVVIMTEVMEHLYRPELAIAEIKRVLKPGGIFLGSVPHENSFNTHKRPLEEHDYHCHVFTQENIEALIKEFSSFSFQEVPWLGDPEMRPQWTCWKAVK